MANDRDQQIVQSAIADTGSGLLEFLPALGAREAIAFGDGMTLPVRIKFDELPKHALPRSSTARFTEKWNMALGDEDFLNNVVERWRHSGNPHALEEAANEAEAAAQQAAAHQAASQAAFAQQAAAQQAAQAAVYSPAPARPVNNGFAQQQRPAAYAQAPAPAYAAQPQQPGYDPATQGFGGGMNQGYGQSQQPPQQPNYGNGYAPQQPAYAQPGQAYGQPPQQQAYAPPPQPAQPPMMQAAAAAPRQASSLLRRATTDQAPAVPAGGLLKKPGGLGGLLRRRET